MQSPSLADLAESLRLSLGAGDSKRKADLGQFLTPAAVAGRMVDLIERIPITLDVLDAGAGVGALTAALCDALLQRRGPLEQVNLTAFEIDPALHAPLEQTLSACEARLLARGVDCTTALRPDDFITASVTDLRRRDAPRVSLAIVNPPYRKLRTDSPERLALRRVGLDANNLYTAFLSLIIERLSPGGTLCAITPRSFCNGPYFLPFRRLLLSKMQMTEVLLFDARDRAFADDKVLQETVIWVAYKGTPKDPGVRLCAAASPTDAPYFERRVPHDEIAPPDHPQRFLFLATAPPDDHERALRALPCALGDLHLQVATGPVVDFRARDFLRQTGDKDAAPLLYPAHLGADGLVRWPRDGLRKPQALHKNVKTAPLLLSRPPYVLLKRFSSKEQPRRLMAAVYDPELVPGPGSIAVENHLNVFTGSGLSRPLAHGLCAFLNASCVDRHFRVFSGHTQVNATDLRSLRYPDADTLSALGQVVLSRGALPPQGELDALVEAAIAGGGQTPDKTP